MRKLIAVVVLTFSFTCLAQTDFNGMLNAAQEGDDMARVLIAYSYYYGEYRDGTKLDKDINLAYGWASLASYQGNTEAKKLVNELILKLTDRDAADRLAGDLFKQYGAIENSARK